MDPNQPNPTPVSQMSQQSIQQIPNPTPNNKKMVIILAAVGTLILIIVTLAAIFFLGARAEEEATPAPTTQAIPTKAEAILNETVTLKQEVRTPVPNTDVTLMFLGRQTPEDCSDCFTTTKIQAEIDGKFADLDYLCGGIAGTCSVKESAMGYSVELKENLDPNQVVVVVTKN